MVLTHAGGLLTARQQFLAIENCKFSVASAANFSLKELGENSGFDRVLCLGVLIYLNDAQILQAIKSVLTMPLMLAASRYLESRWA